MARAVRDLEGIYDYIISEFKMYDTAENIVSLLETSILGLSEMPYRGAIRRVGIYSNKGYRQLFVKNFTIVYRVDEKVQTVIIVTIRYTPSEF